MRLATIAWRGLAARPLRTALAVIGIALGVAVVAATVVTGASSDRALRAATVDLLGAADVRFRAFDETGFTPRSVQSVRAMPEVVAAAPVAERRLMAFTAPGENERVFTITVLGIDPEVDALVRQPRLVAGVAVSAANATDAVVPAALARRYGLALGDELSLNGRREGVPPLRIVGIAADTGLAALDDGEVLLISRATFDESFDAPAPIRSLDVDLGEAPGEDAIARVAAALDEPYIIETADEAAARLGSTQAAFGGIALLFGLVALVVGAFLVANTMAITVGERARELGLLRAAGTTARQVAGIVWRQALALGLAGAALGILLGVLLAAALIGWLGSTRAVLVQGLPLPIGGLAVAAVLGVVATAFGALGPALRSGRLSPLAALRPATRPEGRLAERLRPLVLTELAVVAIGIAAVPVLGVRVALLPVVLSLGLLVGAALAAAFVLEPLARVIGRPFEWFFGAQGLLGRLNLSRDRARTGLTVGAMMVALAAVVALGTVAESARAATEARVASVLPGGHAIRTALPLDVEAFRGSFEATPGLRLASPVLEVPVVRVDGDVREETIVAGIDPSLFQDTGALLVRGASRADAFGALRAGGAALVPVALAERAGMAVGDVMTLALPGSEGRSFIVAGLVEHTLPARTPDGAVLVSAADARDTFAATTASLWILVPQAAVPPTAFAGAVRETAIQLAAEPVEARDLAGDLARTLDGLAGLFDVLALVAVVIGGLGIVNTLGIGVSERVREIAILRAHGMTVGQVQAMVVTEAAIMGAVAGVLAIVTGLIVAGTLVWGGASAELTAGVRLPWGVLLAVVLVGTGVAALAGLYPARVAARMPIVRSLQHFE